MSILKSGSKRNRSIVFVLMIVVLASAASGGFLYLRHVERQDKVAAEEAVASALIALKHRDLSALEWLLYSRSSDNLVRRTNPKRFLKIVESVVLTCGLDTVSDAEVRGAVHTVSNAAPELVSSILKWVVLDAPGRQQIDEGRIRAVPIRYSIDGKDMLSIAVREDDQWKICALPGLSANVLNYPTIDEATKHETVAIE